MAQGERRSGRTQPGGIVGLAEFAEEHREALTYDLITRTHYQLEDVGGALSWGSLASFVKNLGTDSALARDLDKATGWENTLRTNAILADIYDLLQVINANFVAYASGGKKRTKVKPEVWEIIFSIIVSVALVCGAEICSKNYLSFGGRTCIALLCLPIATYSFIQVIKKVCRVVLKDDSFKISKKEKKLDLFS